VRSGTLKCYRPVEGTHSAAGDSVEPVLPTHIRVYTNRNNGSVFIPSETIRMLMLHVMSLVATCSRNVTWDGD